MNNSKFIQDLQKSKFFNLLFNEKNVVMIYLAGSRLYNVIDERSDYDIIVLIKGPSEENSCQYLTYQDKKVHWYWRNFDEFIEIKEKKYPMNYYGNVIFGYLTEDNIIYKNEKYIKQINSLLNNKHNIAINGAKLFYNAMEPLVERICEKLCIDEIDYTKYLGHLCVTSYYLRNEDIDHDIVLCAKRIRWQPIDDEMIAKIVKRLKLLRDWYKNQEEVNDEQQQ